MMGRIFSAAQRTIIWLGEAGDNSDMAMEFVGNVDSLNTADGGTGYCLETISSWTALKKLLQRPWWSRTWTIQEAFLSRDPRVRCGEKEVSLENLVRIYDFYATI